MQHVEESDPFPFPKSSDCGNCGAIATSTSRQVRRAAQLHSEAWVRPERLGLGALAYPMSRISTGK